jgi:hypothetical protein
MMDRTDAFEVASNIKQLGFGEWTDVVDGLVYLSCGDCGMAHAVLLRKTGIDMYRIRIDYDNELTLATRENESLELSLYRELIAKREEVKQLQAQLDSIIEGKSE